MRSCGWSSLLDQPEQVETSQNSNTGLAIGGHASIDDDELAQDLTKLSLCPGTSSTSPPVEFGTAFTPYTTTLRAATWNYRQLRFIFDERRIVTSPRREGVILRRKRKTLKKDLFLLAWTTTHEGGGCISKRRVSCCAA